MSIIKKYPLLIIFLLIIGGYSACGILSSRIGYFKANKIHTIEAYEAFIKKHDRNYFAAGLIDKAQRELDSQNYQQDFQELDLHPSVWAYGIFLTKYPNSKNDSIVISKYNAFLEDLRSWRNPEASNINSIKISTSVNWSQSGTDCSEELIRLFTNIGIEVVPVDSKEYDILLNIEAKGTPRGQSYRRIGGSEVKYFHAGGKVDAEVFMEIRGKEVLRKRHFGVIPEKGFIGPYDKLDIPYSAALYDDEFYDDIFAAINNFFGLRAIVLLLRVPDVGQKALAALEKIDPDWRIKDATQRLIPRLIVGLNSQDEFYRKIDIWALGEIKHFSAIGPLLKISNQNYEVFSALKKISGLDFGDEKNKWEEWWKNYNLEKK
jgi:hypothetical protein